MGGGGEAVKGRRKVREEDVEEEREEEGGAWNCIPLISRKSWIHHSQFTREAISS